MCRTSDQRVPVLFAPPLSVAEHLQDTFDTALPLPKSCAGMRICCSLVNKESGGEPAFANGSDGAKVTKLAPKYRLEDDISSARIESWSLLSQRSATTTPVCAKKQRAPDKPGARLEPLLQPHYLVFPAL
jgi:hypothetical protein